MSNKLASERIEPIPLDVLAEIAQELGEEPRTAIAIRVRHPETVVHEAADAHLHKFKVAVQYAFARGRQAVNVERLQNPETRDAALNVIAMEIQAALVQVLPGTLKSCVRAGGDAGLSLLKTLRTAAPQIKGQPHTRRPPFNLSFDVTNRNATMWIRQHALELASDISKTSRKAITKALVRAFEEGDVAQLEDDIAAAVGDDDRAELIAQSEIMRASNEGQRQSWDQAVEAGLLPPDVRRTWIATGDEIVCDICAELDGTVADLDGLYPDPGGDGPPQHPRCRCTEGIA